MIRTRHIVQAGIALALLAAFCAMLIASILHAQPNAGAQRIERAQRFGSEASQAINAFPRGTSLKLAGSATWDLLGYEFANLGASSARCAVQVYVIGPKLYGRGKDAWAEIFFDGKPVRRFAVDVKQPPPFVQAARKRFYPAIPVAPVFFSPLYRPLGIVVPVQDAAACRSKNWEVGIRVHDASWLVESVGAYLRYQPAETLIAGSEPLTVALAAALALAIFAAIFCAFMWIGARFGTGTLFAAFIVAALATLTHDQWDFPVWVRFVNLTAFGHGNPALMWSGTPLWPYLMALFAPMPLAFYALTHQVSSEIPALFIKLAAAAAYLWTVYVLVQIVPARHRALLFWITLLSPLGLYELAGGYREIFAGLFAVLAFSAAFRERYLVATLLFASAASITESLLPLLFAAPLFVLTLASGDRKRNIAYAVALFALGVAGVAIQWAALPHVYAGHALAFRAHSYRYGEGSWLGLLTDYGIFAVWVGQLWSNWIMLAVFLAISVAFVLRLARAGTPQRSTVLVCIAGLVIAFFLSYRGVDISTWYALLVVLTVVFYVIDPLNPYPLLLSTTAAACQYAVAGTRDFVNWTYLWPVDKGLFGVLGQPVHVFSGVTIALIIAAAVAFLTGRGSALFSSATPYYGGIFLLAGFATTIQPHPLDVAFCVAVAALLSVNLFTLWRLRAISTPWTAPAMLRVFFMIVIAGIIVAFASQNLYWVLIGVTLLFITYAYGAGFGDVPLALGALWLMKTEAGWGWLSLTAYIALLVLCGMLVVRITREPFSRQRTIERG